MQLRQILLHRDGPALWPAWKSATQVLELQATTPPSIWETTYQGNPTPPGGSVFRHEWWIGKNRFDAGDPALINRVIARWMSWDTGLKDKQTSAFSACCVGELWPDYRLALRYVYRQRLEFPALPAEMERLARRFNRDEKLRGILIEDKASGTSAYQTLSASAPDWLQQLLVAFMPQGDKVTRANQAAVWCRNDCVLLPQPGEEALWLIDFEDELFDFPNSAFMDQVDALSQLVLYTENLLAQGWRAREGKGNER
jgi:predicted phage terminase large subunit-like protein